MVTYSGSGLFLDNPSSVLPGKSTWKSPSNIAIVKYWGKHGIQLPRNPSISLTLSRAFSETTVLYGPKKNQDDKIQLSFLFEGEKNDLFSNKLEKHLSNLSSIFPYIKQLSFRIESANSFPHSSGIASSASSMSALAMCLCDIERQLFAEKLDHEEFLKKASFVSRLCSGSACRSVFPFVALWGKVDSIPHSSDYFALDIHKEVAPVFESFHDDILIVSKKEKSVSSTAGHHLMNTNPYASNRFRQACQNTERLFDIMKSGDLEAFGELTESEALTLHALMMCSSPSYILMKPGSISIIEEIRQFRKETHIPVYFSLDAGPNVHVLYPDKDKDEVQKFINSNLRKYCEEDMVIFDQVGSGPEKI